MDEKLTLVEFLLARIADDEAAAHRAAFHVNWPRMCDWIAERSSADVGLFIMDHHPARVLAECEAKRRIVELHGPHESLAGGLPCREMAVVAAVYAAHPDYRDEWRP